MEFTRTIVQVVPAAPGHRVVLWTADKHGKASAVERPVMMWALCREDRSWFDPGFGRVGPSDEFKIYPVYFSTADNRPVPAFGDEHNFVAVLEPEEPLDEYVRHAAREKHAAWRKSSKVGTP